MSSPDFVQAEIHTSDAIQLADVSLVLLDLKSVMALCRRAVAELAKPEPDREHILVEALWNTALIKYVRCFTTGKRSTLSPDVFREHEGGVSTHHHFKHMRDKHVAHSVNPFESAHVAVLLRAVESTPRSVEGVTVFTRSHVSPHEDGFNTLGRLAEVAHRHVAEQEKRLQDRIATWAKAQPVDTFCVGDLKTTAPGPDDAQKPRG